MKHLIAFALVLTVTFCAFSNARANEPEREKPLIQLALLLDASNSMDGLIDQARSQLWTVVNHLAKTKKSSQTPRLEVALYEYGNQGLKQQDGFIRQVLPFTDDLDSVSERLFALRTNGGDEYCGQVIQTAVNDLKWSAAPGVYKTIFIAGNEPFTQGTVDYHGACEAAAKLGIVINTVH